MDLLYCAGGNSLLSDIAFQAGWLLGFRSDKNMGGSPHPVSFIDVEYKKPDFKRHLEIVQRYHPKYATIPDLSEKEVSKQDITRAIDQAKQLAPYCEIVLIVPKLSGQIEMIPQDIAIGYSVPSGYGGAQYPLWELAGRRVHLLGGSPRKQFQTYLHLSAIATVISADGNYAHKMAVSYAMYWQRHKWHYHPLKQSGGKDLYAECWRLSCRNIRAYWQQIVEFSLNF